MNKPYWKAVSDLLKKSEVLSPSEFITESIRTDMDYGVITREEIEQIPDESVFYMDIDEREPHVI